MIMVFPQYAAKLNNKSFIYFLFLLIDFFRYIRVKIEKRGNKGAHLDQQEN